jgi:hypothetical protein
MVLLDVWEERGGTPLERPAAGRHSHGSDDVVGELVEVVELELEGCGSEVLVAVGAGAIAFGLEVLLGGEVVVVEVLGGEDGLQVDGDDGIPALKPGRFGSDAGFLAAEVLLAWEGDEGRGFHLSAE